MKEIYRVELDEEMVALLRLAMELKEQVKQEASFSDRWHELEAQRNEVLRQVGWHLEFEFESLPF